MDAITRQAWAEMRDDSQNPGFYGYDARGNVLSGPSCENCQESDTVPCAGRMDCHGFEWGCNCVRCRAYDRAQWLRWRVKARGTR